MGTTFTRIIIILILSASFQFLGAQEYHQVENNQTLYSIARLYQITLADLMNWNGLKDPRIRPGQRLVVKPAFKLQGPQGDTYVTQAGDTLETLANRFSVSPGQLKAWNNLETEVLNPGKRLAVRQPRPVELYTVQTGDTLTSLSGRYGLSLEELKAINGLTDTRLTLGQSLRVSRPASRPLNHQVQSMDTLEGLAVLYKMDAAQIKALNNLNAEPLRVGQVLKLEGYAAASITPLPQAAGSRPAQVPAPVPEIPAQAGSQNLPQERIQTHQVSQGETFYSIARKYQVPVQDLIQWNQMEGKLLKSGQVLKLQESSGPVSVKPQITVPAVTQLETLPEKEPVIETPKEAAPGLKWDSYVVLNKDIPLFEWNNDFYYWAHPGQTTQPNRGYYENEWTSPLGAFQKAKTLYQGFTELLENRPQKSRALSGLTIVLDPGHGGLDPGAIVKSSDGLGDTLYVTEDEYVYDIAMRMVPLLTEHGAQVQLTVLSPNHLIRDTTPATRTLIHEKNEVFNSLALNQSNTVEAWPVGGARGLERRVQTATELFGRSPSRDTLFMSLHADNSPSSPKTLSILYQGDDSGEDRTSAQLAQSLAKSLGEGAYSKPRDLGVLRGNPASRKVLVEVRNVAFQEHAWALRFADTRQMDAQKLVQGLLDFYRAGAGE